MRVLLTGAGGFVGAHVLRHLLMNTDAEIVCPVSFKHRGLPERIESSICTDPAWTSRVSVPHWDMQAPPSFMVTKAMEGCNVIMNVASESHVDRSIKDPVGFTANNVNLIMNLIEAAKKIRPELILQMSTDEVYGPAPEGYEHKEWDVIAPSNPYAASKAMQEAYCIAAWRTWGLPIVITNTMNIIGEMQDEEKYFPMIIRNLVLGRPIPVHADPDGTPGSRFYLHARNLADAWLWLTKAYTERVEITRLADLAPKYMTAGPSMYADGSLRPDRYNIVGEREIDNAEFVNIIGDILGLSPQMKFVDFHSTRPGHDRRYALDGSKIRQAGWCPPVALDASIKKSVAWYLDNPEWIGLTREDVHRMQERQTAG